VASLFQPTVVRKASDGSRTREVCSGYWVKYRDEHGALKREALRGCDGQAITDREIAERFKRDILTRVERRRKVLSGLIDPFLDSAAVELQTAIAGLIRTLRLRIPRPTRRYLRQLIHDIGELADVVKIERVEQLTAERVELALAKLAARGLAGRTLRGYRQAVLMLGDWCVRRRMLATNPVRSVEKPGGGKTKKQRPLTHDEATRLFAVAGAHELFYRVAAFTGLRWSEVYRLEWQDLDLDGDKPWLRLREQGTKSRRADERPLMADIARRLRAAKPDGAKPTDRVFRRKPWHGRFIGDCVKAGIVERARQGKAGRSSQVADARGRTVGPHSLRRCFATWLRMAGVPGDTVRHLARHTDERLTDTYTDFALVNYTADVNKLPTLDKPTTPDAARACGTYDAPLTGGQGQHLGQQTSTTLRIANASNGWDKSLQNSAELGAAGFEPAKA